MKHLFFWLILLASLFTQKIVAQDIVWTTPVNDLSYLKDAGDVKIEFKYELDSVNGKQEAEFILEQKNYRNMKNEGLGNKWEKEWHSNRSFLFNPSFTQNFNKYLKGKLTVKENIAVVNYKVVITVKAINTGKDNKISTLFYQVPAGGNFLVSIVDGSDKVLASFQMNGLRVSISPRNDDNFFPWINEAFAKAGRIAAQELLSKM